MENFILILIILLILIFGLRRTNSRKCIRSRNDYSNLKGEIGEITVADILSRLPEDKYIVLNNLMFNSGAYTTQIDHIVVSVYGIFVIETKNYSGVIFGSLNKDTWIQDIFGNRYTFYNPIYQNRKHIAFILREFSELKLWEHFYSIVTFVGRVNLKLYGNCKGVVGLSDLTHYILSFSQSIMTINECNRMADVLRNRNIDSVDQRIVHNANVRSAIQNYENKISQSNCPQCGGRLILRNSKYRNFYGCSNYPRCHFIRQC